MQFKLHICGELKKKERNALPVSEEFMLFDCQVFFTTF